MPVISTFFGIVVRMFYQEHEPAHFHAEYQGQQGKFDFAGEVIVAGRRPRSASFGTGRYSMPRNSRRIGRR